MPEGKWMGDTADFLGCNGFPAIFSGSGLFLGITVTSPVRWHALCCNKEIHKFASFLNTRDIEGCGAHPGVALVLSPYLDLSRLERGRAWGNYWYFLCFLFFMLAEAWQAW